MGLGLGVGVIGPAAQAQDDIIGGLLRSSAPRGAATVIPATVRRTVEPKWISLRNLHTAEKLEAVYWENGAYVPDALGALNKVLRDYRTGDVTTMNLQLFDMLGEIRRKTESRQPFEVISAYRSPTTNAMLSARSGQVAKRSLHMDGKAMDIHLQDVSLDRLRLAALDIGRGGVGYYPRSGFVHVDVGPVRRWQGS